MAIDWALILLGVGIICGIMLIAMAFMGGMDVGADVDTDAGGGPGPFGLPTMLSILSVFGLSGFLITTWSGNLNLGLIGGLVVGVCVGSIIFLLLARLLRAQTSSDFRIGDVVGMIGEVTVPISRSDAGQILVITEERGRNLVSASSDSDCAVGARVKILGTTGASVIVEPLKKEVRETKMR